MGIVVRERRKFERTSSTIRVKLSHPSFGTIAGMTSDISDGGVHVLVENTTLPPKGTVVKAQFSKWVGDINVDPVDMKVVRVTNDSMGLMFLPR